MGGFGFHGFCAPNWDELLPAFTANVLQIGIYSAKFLNEIIHTDQLKLSIFQSVKIK